MIRILTLIKQKLTQPLFLRLVFAMLMSSLFLEVKYPIINSFGYFLGEKKDFTIIFAYLSDIILLGWIFIAIYYNLPLSKRENRYLGENSSFASLLLIILIVTSYYINYSKLIIPIISIYILIYLTKLIVLHGTLSICLDDLFKIFKGVFLLFIGLECALAIYQFWNQASLGLQKVGESMIGPYIFSVAKVEAFGQVFIRSYGTFAHPNVFGAFLVIGLVISLAAFINANLKSRLVLLLLVGIQTFGLTLTFSRSAWLVAMLAILIFVCLTWNIDLSVGEKLYPAVLLILLSFVVIGIIYLPFIAERGRVAGTTAYTERTNYNTAGLKMIIDYAVFGVGPGQSLLHMEHYMPGRIEPWDIQPIHNYYLLFTTELGLPAFFVFALYISYVLQKSFRVYKAMTNLDVEFICLLSCLIAILILMMFDHYFYTLESPAILFWVVLGLLVNKLYRLEKIGDIQNRIMN